MPCPKFFKLAHSKKGYTLNDWVKSFDLEFIKQIIDQTTKDDKPKNSRD